ncbi:MAG: CoA transferase subunit A [Myxococcales bacterium]|nr:CoA transferase subunit A [Myxococcales bacterium]
MKETPYVFPREGVRTLINPPDLEALREHNRHRSKALVDKRMTEDEAIARFVRDGQYIGIELYGTVRCPMSLTRALIRSGKKNFDLAGQGVHEADLLLAAGIVKRIDCTYIGQEVYGVSPLLRRAVESGQVTEVIEWSNGAITWRFKAAAMGVPFLPTYSMLGTDTLKYSAAKVIDDPFTRRPVALLPALVLDVGFIHVNRADKFGNCQIDGISGFAAEMARASKKLVISAEEIVDSEVFRAEPNRTIIPWYCVDAVVPAPFGCWPGEMTGCYERDEAHYKMFIETTQTAEGAAAYLKEWVDGVRDHQALLDKIGRDKLQALRIRK